MKTYALVMFLATLCGIFLLARIALKWLRVAQVLKQVCRHLIVINFRLQKKPYTIEEVEEALEKLMAEFSI